MTDDELLERIALLEATPLNAPRINWPVLVVMISSCLASALIAITLPFARNASNTSEDLARSTEISGCRAAANADVVDARTNVDAINVELNLLDNRFNDAILNNDQAEVDTIRPLGAPLRRQLEAETANYRAKNDAYQTAVRLSVDAPDEFLRLCRQNALIPPTTTTVATLTGAIGPTTTTTATTAPRGVSRRTTRTRPATTTTGSTTTTTRPQSPRPTSPPCADLLPLPVPLELPCL